MSFRAAIQTCFAKYFVFSGRARRPEYWWFVLFITVGVFVVSFADRLLSFGDTAIVAGLSREAAGFDTGGGLGSSLFLTATIVPLLAVGWRRMHDAGSAGWLCLLPLVLFSGLLVFDLVVGALLQLGDRVVEVVFNSALVCIAVSFLLVTYWLARPTQRGPNPWGPEPIDPMTSTSA